MSSDYVGQAFPKRSSSNPKHDGRLTPEKFRHQIWLRDGARCRATGEPVSNMDDCWQRLGNVCHLRSRGAYPELATDPENAVLMSGLMHWYSDSRGNNRLKLSDPDTGEPATNGARPIRFTMHDLSGRVLWSRVR